MADNPLLPQDRLRDLHSLMQRARKLDRGRQPAAREALIAATLIHLSQGDLVSTPGDDPSVTALAPKPAAGAETHVIPQNLRIPLCAGAAQGMRTAGTDRLTVAFAQAGAAETGWADALRWAFRDQLPLLLVVFDTSAPLPRSNKASSTSPLTWPELTTLARSLHLPYFPVDGADAVAVFRVIQETSARARSGGGPSVIWAVLSSERLPPRQQPLGRLEAYMRARGISLNR